MDAAHAAGTQITPVSTTGSISETFKDSNVVRLNIDFTSTLAAGFIPAEGDYVDYILTSGAALCIDGGATISANDADKTVIGTIEALSTSLSPRVISSSSQPNTDPAKQALSPATQNNYARTYRLTFNGNAAQKNLTNISYSVSSKNCENPVLWSKNSYSLTPTVRVNDVNAAPAFSTNVEVPASQKASIGATCVNPMNAMWTISADGDVTEGPLSFLVRVKEGDTIPVGSRLAVKIKSGPVRFNATNIRTGVGYSGRQVQLYVSEDQVNPSGIILLQAINPSFSVVSVSADELVFEVTDHDIAPGSYGIYTAWNVSSLTTDYKDYINYDIQPDGSQGSRKSLSGVVMDTLLMRNGVSSNCATDATHRLDLAGVVTNASGQNIPKGSVFASYVDEAGDPIGVVVDENGAADGQVTVADQQFQGTAYTAEQKTIEGYTFVRMGDNSPAATGRVLPDDQTVVFVYKKNVPATPVTPDPVDPTPVVTPTPSDPAPTPVKKVVKKTLAFTGSQAWTLMGAAAVLAGTGVGAVALRRRKA